KMSLPHPFSGASGPTPRRAVFESLPELEAQATNFKNGLKDNYGRFREVTLDPQQEKELAQWAGVTMHERMTEARAVSMKVADETAKFVLHDYPHRYGLDTALSYIWPYQFWHSRTYVKWMKRLASNPFWITKYYAWRRAMEKTHADLPEWMRYNLNSNEVLGFLGIKSEHPLFFNLESMLNPMMGMSAVDFKDPKMRQDWLSTTLSDLNRFGPSIWTPYQLGVALKFHMEGKDEAAGRWGGRAWMGTRAIRDGTALLGLNAGKGYEVDPFIHLFSGGIDPRERARIGQELTAMMNRGEYTEAELIDAAHTQEGPIWEKAWTGTVQKRAGGNVASFFLGGSAKTRSENDVMVDRFYKEMWGLIAKRHYVTKDEYSKLWDGLKQRYPFADLLLLSKKGGPERDEALAWNVLGRIAPGQTDDIAELVSMDYDVVTKFYEDKGKIEDWDDKDRMELMAGIMRAGALLDVPPQSTKAQWRDARDRYRAMMRVGEEQFGEDIWAMVDAFWESDDKDAFTRNNPIVATALDFKSGVVMSDPFLAAYYTSIDRIEKYMLGNFYQEAAFKYGEDLWDLFGVHGKIKEIDPKAAKKFWKDHPQLGQYIDDRDARKILIENELERFTDALPEDAPMMWREDEAPEGFDEEVSREEDPAAWMTTMVAQYTDGKIEPDIEQGDFLKGAAIGEIAQYLLSTPGGSELFR
ncbi:MAG: hypothetical protein ACYTEO_19255, partial [Planctomycetota bacterium]